MRARWISGQRKPEKKEDWAKQEPPCYQPGNHIINLKWNTIFKETKSRTKVYNCRFSRCGGGSVSQKWVFQVCIEGKSQWKPEILSVRWFGGMRRMDLALNQSFFNWKLVWKPEIRDIGKALFWENCSSWLRNLNLSDVGEGDGGGGHIWHTSHFRLSFTLHSFYYWYYKNYTNCTTRLRLINSVAWQEWVSR